MKLSEMFNSADKEKAIANFNREREFYNKAADRSTNKGDWIVTQYELGKISYDEALQQLKDVGAGEYEYELAAAKDTKEYRLKKNH